MGTIGAPELLILLVIIVVLFGASRLPKIARGVGEAVRELRHATSDDEA
jgi:sec-independent protein translocase protein TatA